MDELCLRTVVRAADSSTLAALACCNHLLRQLVMEETADRGEFRKRNMAPLTPLCKLLASCVCACPPPQGTAGTCDAC